MSQPAERPAEPTGEDWAFIGQSVCIVSSWPPARDGIARFAEPVATVLARTRRIRRVGFPEGGGEHRRALHRGLRALKLLPDAHGFEDILVQYHPHYYVRGGWLARVASYVSWAALVRLRDVTFVVHEIDDPRAEPVGRRGRAQFAVEEAVRRVFWARAARLAFLSAWQRDRFLARFPAGRRRELLPGTGPRATRTAGRPGRPADDRILESEPTGQGL
jgi:hypothetical protein